MIINNCRRGTEWHRAAQGCYNVIARDLTDSRTQRVERDIFVTVMTGISSLYINYRNGFGQS